MSETVLRMREIDDCTRMWKASFSFTSGSVIPCRVSVDEGIARSVANRNLSATNHDDLFIDK